MNSTPAATRMMTAMVDRDRVGIAREASRIAEAAARIAEDVDGSVSCGEVSRLTQEMQQLLIRSTRFAAMREALEMQAAE